MGIRGIPGRHGRRGAVGLAAAVALIAGMLVPLVPAAAQPTPAIEFINPGPRNPSDPMDGGGHTRIVSDRAAAGDTAYRFNAWVNNVPPDPIVEFELDRGLLGRFPLGQGVRVGGSNVWQLQRSIPSTILDGTYPLRAVLFSGGLQVAVVEREISLRHGAADSSTAAPRSKFTYPTNNGQAGFALPPGSTTASILLEANSSGGANFVRAFFSTSPPGQPVEWQLCGTATASAAAGAGLRCTLPADLDPLSVSAVAVVANSSPPNTPIVAANDQAGDAVAIQPYVQVPSAIAVTPPQAARAGSGCASFTTLVTDQVGRRVHRANLDVHGVGPSDILRFDTVSGNTVAPDEGGHDTEIGYDCFFQIVNPLDDQGLHRRALFPDIKHLESGGAGTSNAGTWPVSVNSEEPGDTHLTFWADLNDDDVWQEGEPCVATAVRWGDGEVPGTVPTPQSEFPGCAIASPDQPIDPPEPPGPPANADLQPQEQAALTGDVREFVVTVTDAQGTPATGEPVQWQTSGPGQIESSDSQTNQEGRASVRVASDETGDQTISVSATRCAAGADCTDSALMQWRDQTVQSGPCAGFPVDARTPRTDGVEGMVVVGTPGDDVLVGSSGHDIICGLAGDDVLRGLGGNDLLVGGAGNDELFGGRGNDILRGGGGNDILRGGRGRDILRGGGGNDILRGGRGADRLFGGPGNDRLFGGPRPGRNILNGGRGFDRCTGRPNTIFRRSCNVQRTT